MDATFREIVGQIVALRRQVERLEARAGRGDSQRLDGSGIAATAPVYFLDGTWVDEANPTTPEYGFSQTIYHGSAGIKQDWTGGAAGGHRREVYLRLTRAVRLLAGRNATFCISLQGLLSPEGGMSAPPNRLDLTLGFITAEFAQATLEAMTWNNKLASDAGHLLGRYYLEATAAEWPERPEGTWGQDAFEAGQPGTAPVAGEDCMAVTVRVRPVAAVTLTGVRLWIPPGTDEYEDADGSAWVMRTRAGDPHRSFVVVEP